MAKNILIQPTPNQNIPISPDFVLEDFDNSIWNKGYKVIHEKTLKCPCKSKSSSSLSTCKNCQGSGWIVIDATETKMLISSINSSTKYKSWSEENMGTINISASIRDRLSFMDKIVVLDSTAIMNELLYTQNYSDEFFVYTIYDILNIKELFLFVDSNLKLKRLVEGTDYTILKNKISIISQDASENMQLSVRYEHNTVYGILDLPHDIRNSYRVNNEGINQLIELPVQAVGRRFHFILDRNYDYSSLHDNSSR